MDVQSGLNLILMGSKMGIRDEELHRLKKYAEGLGVKVYFKKYIASEGHGLAEWDMVERAITIYEYPGVSKTKLILAFLHELGHHLDWIHNGKKELPGTERVFEKLAMGLMTGKRPDLTKTDREIILREERAGIAYMDVIHKELDLKLALWKVKLMQTMDLFDYEYLYKHGRFSTVKEYGIKKKELKPIYIKRYGNK